MDLNDAGQIVNTCWLEIQNHFPHALLDEFVIMPNHIHGIIIINEMYKKSNETNFNANVGNIIVETKNFSSLQLKNDTLINDKLNQNKNKQPRGTSKTIGSMVRGFKIGVTKWFRQNTRIHDVWQRNYYEHIIRNKNEFNIIRHYINNNPLNWKNDSNYSS
jgi:REP element-mobilizing transposase RayT